MLGTAIARVLLRDSLHVALIDRDAVRLHATVDALSGLGYVTGVVADITDDASVSSAVQAVAERWDRIDVFVHNAGVEIPFDLEAADPGVWDLTFAVNARAAMIFAAALTPLWKQQRSGTMVSIGSRTWLSGSSPAPYAASKAALVGFSRAVATQLGPYGITANVVAPSFMPTPLNSRGDAEALADYTRRFVDASALGRLVEPSDVAEAVAFLASPRARNITGEVLNVAAGSHFPPAVR